MLTSLFMENDNAMVNIATEQDHHNTRLDNFGFLSVHTKRSHGRRDTITKTSTT